MIAELLDHLPLLEPELEELHQASQALLACWRRAAFQFSQRISVQSDTCSCTNCTPSPHATATVTLLSWSRAMPIFQCCWCDRLFSTQQAVKTHISLKIKINIVVLVFGKGPQGGRTGPWTGRGPPPALRPSRRAFFGSG